MIQRCDYHYQRGETRERTLGMSMMGESVEISWFPYYYKTRKAAMPSSWSSLFEASDTDDDVWLVAAGGCGSGKGGSGSRSI